MRFAATTPIVTAGFTWHPEIGPDANPSRGVPLESAMGTCSASRRRLGKSVNPRSWAGVHAYPIGLVVATPFVRCQSSPSWWRLIRTTSPGLKGGPGTGMTAVEVLQFET